jgi:simple sugar transport system ATP-binding protein
MVGREIGGRQAWGARPGNRPVLELRDVWGDGDRAVPALAGVTLTVRAGELVAVAGVAGNGQRELAEAIAGLRPCTKGSIRVVGEPLKNGDARAAFEACIGYIPEDRLGTGVSPSLSIAMNVDLRAFRAGSAGPFLRLRRMRDRAVEAIRRFDIRGATAELRTDYLSGGNVQKVVIAREFDAKPSLLVAAAPTRGLDVAAVEQVRAYLLEAVEFGAGVLLISEDLDEILGLNDRILVMYEGRLSEVDDRDSVAEIGLRMAGGTP